VAAVLGLVVTALAAAGCGDDRGGSGQGVGAVTSRPIESVLADHAAELMAHPGVVGVYQGQRDDGTPVIRVLVLEKTPALERDIPPRLEGHPVDIEVTGEIRPMR
jgi:hypothetical protein